MAKRMSMIGFQSGGLKVVAFSGFDARRNSRWVCECTCGNQVTHTGTNLKRLTLKSCGCRQYVSRVDRRAEDHPDFRVFCGMLSRCHNPKCRQYPRYGGRGFTVCDRWREGGFWVFIEDMGPRPTALHSIDRIDNNKGYSPENCRWATPKEQGNNRRTNKRLAFDNRIMTMTEWATHLGINYRTLKGRIRKGWPLDRALSPELVDTTATDDVVRSIRAERRGGAKGCQLAIKYGVSESFVSEVCSGKKHANVV